jgi:hypothetical protein
VRISRGRLALRGVLLLVGGAFMAWKAWETRAAAVAGSGPERALGERIAAVEALVALLAVLTAVAALWRLRRKERRHSLHL